MNQSLINRNLQILTARHENSNSWFYLYIDFVQIINFQNNQKYDKKSSINSRLRKLQAATTIYVQRLCDVNS